MLFEKPGRHPGQIAGRSPYLQPVQVMAPDALIGDDRARDASTTPDANSLFGVARDDRPRARDGMRSLAAVEA